MIILGIETSCDETGVSVVEAGGSLESPVFKVLGSALHSQVKLHEQYGGVYPNLAKREHIKNLPIVLEEALGKANCGMENIESIAVTVGPGLEPALWTGINFAENLAKQYNVPLIPTNHMEGHIASVLLNGSDSKVSSSKLKAGIEFPALALLISGGHTELVYLKNWNEKEIIGETKDDAVGEAFDKVARMLGLPYPGGPEISALAERARTEKLSPEVSDKIKLPRPMINSGDYNFSFSGLKTAVLYKLRELEKSSANEPSEPDRGELEEFSSKKISVQERRSFFPAKNLQLEFSREFEDAVVEVLLEKSRKAILEYKPKTFIIGGGVIANKYLRERFQKMIGELPEVTLQIPERELATDNAVMIAMAGYLSHLSHTDTKLEMKARGNLKYV